MRRAQDLLKSQDLWAGAVFVAIGAAALLTGSGYEMGSAARMGPGYVPRLLGLGLVLLGLVIAALGLVKGGEALAPVAPRPLIGILGGTLLFGLMIDRLGLVVTVVAVTCVTAYAARERPGLIHILLLGAALALGCALLFVWGLRQAVPLWWAT